MIALFKNHSRIVTACILTALFTGPGQTYLLALFTPYLLETFQMSRTALSSCFSLATLSGILILPALGKKMDRHPFVPVAFLSGFIVCTGLGLLAISQNILMVFLGYLCVRSFGHGSFTVLYSSTIARIFGENRGKALAIANIGHSIGQGLFPITTLFFIHHFGWRFGLAAIAVCLILVYFPLISILVSDQNTHVPIYQEKESVAQYLKNSPTVKAHKDFRFYYVSIANVLTPFVMTSLFYHQDHLMAFKGWTSKLFALSMTVFALSQFAANISAGFLIDRFTARKIMPFTLLPLLGGLLALVAGEDPLWCAIFLGLAGLTVPLNGSTKNGLWPEVYGTESLGEIRGLDTQFLIIAMSLGPIVYSLLLDLGLSTAQILQGLIFLTILGILIHTSATFFYSEKFQVSWNRKKI